jgi:hypothetical protein
MLGEILINVSILFYFVIINTHFRGEFQRHIKVDLLETGVSVVDWICLAQDKYRWRALVNSVMNLRVP